MIASRFVLPLLALVVVVLPTDEARAADETSAVWRVQLTVNVCDNPSAGTDNAMRIMLNDWNEESVLDHPNDDFERASAMTYDLRLTNVARLSDIRYLRIFKRGDDGVCLNRVLLTVNGRLVYLWDTRTTPEAWRWLDNHGYDHRTWTIDSAALRAHPYWQSYTSPPVNSTLSFNELQHRVAVNVGTQHDHSSHDTTSYRWGTGLGSVYEGVKVSMYDLTSVHVHVPSLRFSCVNWVYGVDVCRDADYEGRFRLRFSCGDGILVVTAEAIRINRLSGQFGEYNSLASHVLSVFERAARAAAADLTHRRVFGTCPNIDMQSTSIRFL